MYIFQQSNSSYSSLLLRWLREVARDWRAVGSRSSWIHRKLLLPDGWCMGWLPCACKLAVEGNWYTQWLMAQNYLIWANFTYTNLYSQYKPDKILDSETFSFWRYQPFSILISKECCEKQPKIRFSSSKYSYFMYIFCHRSFRNYSCIPKCHFKIIKSGS